MRISDWSSDVCSSDLDGEDEGYRMKLPAYRAEAKPLPDIARAMGGDVVETLWHEGGYALIVYHSAEEVRALTPDLAALSEGDILYIATAPGTGDPSGADVVSRAFAPGAGLPDDPVTGSAHSLLQPSLPTPPRRDPP